MKIIAVDPGYEQSAWVRYDPEARHVHEHAITDNDALVTSLVLGQLDADVIVIEMVASYGMAVGREVFETVFWIGRFAQAANGAVRLFRRDVKMHLCGNNKASDANIRCALLDKFGPGKSAAVGVKSAPGPLYGIVKDEWAALALAVTFAETRLGRTPELVAGDKEGTSNARAQA